MPYLLLYPNQLRHNGLIVNDIPRAYDPNSSHSITIPGKLNLPLKMFEVMSYLPTRKPLDAELLHCEQFELTSVECWEPHKLSLDQDNNVSDILSQESRGQYYTRTIREPIELDMDLNDRFIQTLHTALPSASNEAAPHHEADVIAYGDKCHDLLVVDSKPRHIIVTGESLAQLWFTGLEAAKRTLLATTQEGMRFVGGPVERRLRTSQAHLRFPSPITTLYSDTLFSHTHLVRGHTCAQIFTDGHGFVRVYSMKSKSESRSYAFHP